MILRVAGDNARTAERPVVVLTDRDNLARIAVSEVVERIVAGDTGDSGDQKRQGDRFIDARDHEVILDSKREGGRGKHEWNFWCESFRHLPSALLLLPSF